MSKTIKVIDLLNKIANGEEVPERIKYEKDIFKYVKCWEQYVEKDTEKSLLKIISAYNYSGLNDTVEIIEEEPEINIQSIEEQGQFCNLIGLTENEEILWKMIQSNANVIDEVIRAVKQLDNQINKLRQENEQLKSDLGYTRKVVKYTGDHIPRID